jgi:hypothetical protein
MENSRLCLLAITSRDEYNTIIPAAAHAMNSGDFGANACSDLYEEIVIAFVDSLLQ